MLILPLLKQHGLKWDIPLNESWCLHTVYVPNIQCQHLRCNVMFMLTVCKNNWQYEQSISFYMNRLHNRLLKRVDFYLLVYLRGQSHPSSSVGPTTVQANRKQMFYIYWIAGFSELRFWQLLSVGFFPLR